MIGYHYTTAAAWAQIQREGLKRFPLKPHQQREFCGLQSAIWIYPQQQTGPKMLGLFCERVQQYRVPEIVELAVEYDRWSTFVFALNLERPDTYYFTHNGWWQVDYDNGAIQHRDYWHEEEPLDLLIKPVPPEHITLSRTLSITEWQ